MSNTSSQLASAAQQLASFNNTLDDVCKDLAVIRTAKDHGSKLSAAKSHNSIGRLPSKLKSIVVSVMALEKDYDSLKAELDTLDHELQVVEKENDKLKKENTSLKAGSDTSAQLRQSRRENDRLQKENQELIEQLQDADSNSSNIRRLKADNTKLKDDIVTLKTEKSGLLHQLQDSNSNSNTVRKLKTDILDLKTSQLTLKTEKADLKKERNELKTEKIELEKSKAGLKLEKQALQKQVNDLQKISNEYGPQRCKEPKCRGCQKRIYHRCTEFGQDRWVRFDDRR